MHTKDFYLHDDEEIVEGLEPSRSFQKYLFLRWLIILAAAGAAVAMAAVAIHIYYPLVEVQIFLANYVEISCAWVAVSFFSSYTISKLEWKKRFYWITNHRLVVSHGIIRHCVYIVDLYEINELTMTQTYIQRKFNSKGIKVRSYRGNFNMGGISGTEGIFLELSGMVKERRRAEGLIF